MENSIKINSYTMEITEKKIAILGFGREGASTLTYLLSQ